LFLDAQADSARANNGGTRIRSRTGDQVLRTEQAFVGLMSKNAGCPPAARGGSRTQQKTPRDTATIVQTDRKYLNTLYKFDLH
jgi:hypothetical protein